MRTSAVLLFIALLLLAGAATSVQAQGAPFDYPPETEVLRGVIEVRGTAEAADFWKYELAAAPAGTQNWFNLGVSETPVRNGVLGQWDTRTVADGVYTLRLRVVRRDGNYTESLVQRVQVANSAPPPTPTPAESPTPTITPTSEPPTATPVILTPDIPTPTPGATETPTPVAGVVAPAEGSAGPEATAETGASLTTVLSRIGSGVRMGARTVLLAFAAVGFFFGFKNLFTWLYNRYLLDR